MKIATLERLTPHIKYWYFTNRRNSTNHMFDREVIKKLIELNEVF